MTDLSDADDTRKTPWNGAKPQAWATPLKATPRRLERQLIDQFRAVLGARIVARRRLIGLTQADLAATCRMPRSTLSEIETGTRSVPARRWDTLCRVLGVSSEEMLDGGVREEV